ncbi:hypothetical protein R3W88_000664 [Solanum pinnatisectum]|uniref:Uncharacterized protein n=1 Tax=Solanum pinnatisectum TaxID=50273 RepID=A0AAV9MI12_9SOLN|nr:hypothetical protein R3W88_000664 [Solanum pinnatisectum]
MLSENFKIITLWNASLWMVTYELLEVNGKLGVIDYGSWVDGFFDLIARLMIQFPSIWNDVVIGPISSCMSRDEEIVFVVNLNSGSLCSCYDVNTNILRELGILGLPEKTNNKGIYSYIERLVI